METKFVVLYARYSSNNQREESIEAQIRAIEDFCHRKGWVILRHYIDRALSGTSEKRKAFQELLADSKKKEFQAVVVHKLDRWARDRVSSAMARYELRKNGVSLLSVLENLNDSPESIMLESLLEGMAEYYSANLQREIKKGQKESAMQCRHLGGKPPLGYSVEPDTKKYMIDPVEAEIVRTVFGMYERGESYGKILNYLNANGHRTKFAKLLISDN